MDDHNASVLYASNILYAVVRILKKVLKNTTLTLDQNNVICRQVFSFIKQHHAHRDTQIVEALRYVFMHVRRFTVKRENDFLVAKLCKLITDELAVQPTAHILDFGGGNGDTVQRLALQLGLDPSSSAYCVESQHRWSEDYAFDRVINYIFWDDRRIDMPCECLDVVLGMVVFHHLPYDTLDKAVREIYRLLKPGGVLIVKEHDSTCATDVACINWEHILYHVVYDTHAITADSLQRFMHEQHYNYMSFEFLDGLLRNVGFERVARLDRGFVPASQATDEKNITKLYFGVYKKRAIV